MLIQYGAGIKEKEQKGKHTCEQCGTPYRCGHSDCHHKHVYGWCSNECLSLWKRVNEDKPCVDCMRLYGTSA